VVCRFIRSLMRNTRRTIDERSSNSCREGTTRSENVEMLLIWRSSALSDTLAREEALEEFRQALSDVLDWTTARYSDGEILMHA